MSKLLLKNGYPSTSSGHDALFEQPHPLSFQFGKEEFSARSRKSMFCAETYLIAYVAQAKLKIDAEIAEKNPLRMET